MTGVPEKVTHLQVESTTRSKAPFSAPGNGREEAAFCMSFPLLSESPAPPAAGFMVPELHRLPSLLHRPMHAANLHFLRGGLFRLVAGMSPSFAPLLDHNSFLRSVLEAQSREDVAEVMRQLATRISRDALQPCWFATYKDRLESLSSEPHFSAFLHFFASIYTQCLDRQAHMQRWFVEVDSRPFEHALQAVLLHQQAAAADDAANDLTHGVTFEGMERLFESRRQEYHVVAVEDDGVRRATKGALQAPDLHAVYRIELQRGDGKCLVLFKRYSELFALMAALEGPKARSSCLFPTLQPAFKTAGGRLFPGKHPFNPNLNLHHTTRSQRARLFKDYLNSLFRERDVHTTEALCTFLDYTPANGYPFRVPRSYDWSQALRGCKRRSSVSYWAYAKASVLRGQQQGGVSVSTTAASSLASSCCLSTTFDSSLAVRGDEEEEDRGRGW